MSSFFSIKYIPDSSLLPAELDKGCLYFVGDEQVIIVDNGDGPVIYGASHYPAPYASSDSSPSLKEQIDTLASADIAGSLNWYYETVRTRKELSRLEERITALTSALQEQATSNAEGILQLSRTLNSESSKFTSEISVLAKTITQLHPYADLDSALDDIEHADPLDYETVETDAGQWVIQQTYNPDGTMTLELQAVSLKVNTLEAGDTLTYDGSTWTVESIEDGGDTLTLTLNATES